MLRRNDAPARRFYICRLPQADAAEGISGADLGAIMIRVMGSLFWDGIRGIIETGLRTKMEA